MISVHQRMPISREIYAPDKKITMLQFMISIQQRMACCREILAHYKNKVAAFYD